MTRVGWSEDFTDLQLGEVANSYGYGGTAKKSHRRQFHDYGIKFGVGDVVTCYLGKGKLLESIQILMLIEAYHLYDVNLPHFQACISTFSSWKLCFVSILKFADKRDDGSAEISYAVNGRFLGYAFQICASNKPLFPHVSMKNMKFTVGSVKKFSIRAFHMYQQLFNHFVS